MKVFVTGGSGYVGSAIVAELVRAGHRVTGLARSGPGAERLRSLGAASVDGDLGRPEEWAAEAASHDAVVHVAQDGGAADREAADVAVLRAVLAAAEGSGSLGAFVYTSNAFLLGDQGDGLLSEDDPLPGPPRFAPWRLRVEAAVLDAATERVATSVVRPGQVYGGDGGTLPLLFASAVDEGAAAYVGDGRNRWSMVHREDLAALYRRTVEARARGVFHGVDERPLTVGEVARAASEAAGAEGRTRAIPLEAAREEYGGFADMLALDVAVSPRRSLALGWRPARESFTDAADEAFREWRRLSRGEGE